MIKSIAKNKKAWHEFFIEEEFEAGLELFGTEVKSIRLGGVNLKDSYVDIDSGQAYIVGMHISPYEKGNIFNKDPLRVRRLLLNKKEINKLIGKVQEKGLTIIPLEIYFKGRWAKLKIALARGKKLYDKRDDAAERSARRHMERALKERNL
ncbi:SsrA-binding protein SmpB [Acetivibrio sp. MSJd-27]|uniref:SsrA-binding protein SmpB n=1 Tax=Acetivibrio sp. MSJd-27 TaxID=2841523 RepID=UPI001C127F5B|nr:SsrA-binding protein SmpB [Acetivibrio sp. MSJd-27]MBU5449946.1 SsrA-binding protein SmpB [Acetivibrio sp. MSJd-27]